VSEVLAVIPARGGSKSIPRKNARPLGGHPLLAWSIAAARASRRVTRVLVSTDDPELRALALAYGAEAPFLRPPELARDDTRDFPVVRHALDWLERAEGLRPELIVQLRPTSPLRPRDLVDAAVARLESEPRAESLRAVVPAAQNPYKMWRRDGDWLTPLASCETHEPYNAPRQELPAAFWQTGHIDVVRRATIERGSLTGTRVLPFALDPRYAVDIDTLDHWRAAEALLAAALACVRPADDAAPRAPFEGVRLVVFDFDGVFTDDRVLVLEDGREAVTCSRGDGLGLARLRAAGLRAAVLSSEVNAVVAARCRKLGLDCRQAVTDKGAALRALADEAGVPLPAVAYVGNDVNDLPALRLAGVAVAVADAHPEARAAAQVVLERGGGRGAVRELCERVLAAAGVDLRPAEVAPLARGARDGR
jgi:N-acylneuraminate cytidylyltransferase